MIHELRIYRTLPGRLPNLLARFQNHTLRIWEKHGIRQAGFWTTLIGESNNELTYLLGVGIAGGARDEMVRLHGGSGMARRAQQIRKGRPDRRHPQQPDPGADRVLVGEIEEHKKKPPRRGPRGLRCMLVAGAGFEPAAFRL